MYNWIHNGTSIVDPYSDETGRLPVNPFEYYFTLTTLSQAEGFEILADGYGLVDVHDFDLYLTSISNQVELLSSRTYSLLNLDADGHDIFGWYLDRLDYRSAASTVWADQVDYIEQADKIN